MELKKSRSDDSKCVLDYMAGNISATGPLGVSGLTARELAILDWFEDAAYTLTRVDAIYAVSEGGGGGGGSGCGGGSSGRGLHSSTFRLNVSTFVGCVGCMIFPESIRQGDTGRCDQNGFS